MEGRSPVLYCYTKREMISFLAGIMMGSIENLLQQISNSNRYNSSVTSKYFKINQAAEFLSTTSNAVRLMVSKDQIPYFKKQGKLIFKESQLIKWLENVDKEGP